MRLQVLLCAALMLGWGLAATAQVEAVPSKINYQGTLLKADGSPETGAQNLEFRFYTNATDAAASALWAEQHTSVQLVGGMFNIVLGNGAAIGTAPHTDLKTILTTSALWLGVCVAGGSDANTRQQMTSVPYALTADTAVRAKHGSPPGTIAMWAGKYDASGRMVVPEGWLLCNGASLSKTESGGKYKNLSDALGTTWGGSGDTFNVPDLGGFVTVGAGQGKVDPNNAASANLSNRALGSTAGSETHTLTTAQMPSHTHSFTDNYSPEVDTMDPQSDDDTNIALDNSYVGRTTDATGGGLAHNNMQPSVVMVYIIKY